MALTISIASTVSQSEDYVVASVTGFTTAEVVAVYRDGSLWQYQEIQEPGKYVSIQVSDLSPSAHTVQLRRIDQDTFDDIGEASNVATFYVAASGTPVQTTPLLISSISHEQVEQVPSLVFYCTGLTPNVDYAISIDGQVTNFFSSTGTMASIFYPESSLSAGSHVATLSQVDSNGNPIGNPSPGVAFTKGGAPTVPTPIDPVFLTGLRPRVWINDIEITIGYDYRRSLTDDSGLGTRPERRVATAEQAGRQGVLSSLRTDVASTTYGATAFALPMVIQGGTDAKGNQQHTQAASQVAATLLRELSRETAGLFTITVQDVFGVTWTNQARRTGELPRSNNARQWLFRFSLNLQLDVPMWTEVGNEITFTISDTGYIDALEDLDGPIDDARITIPGNTFIQDRQSGARLQNRGSETITVRCSPSYGQNPRTDLGSVADLYWRGPGAFIIGDGSGTPYIEHSGGAVTVTCNRKTLSPL